MLRELHVRKTRSARRLPSVLSRSKRNLQRRARLPPPAEKNLHLHGKHNRKRPYRQRHHQKSRFFQKTRLVRQSHHSLRKREKKARPHPWTLLDPALWSAWQSLLITS